MVYWAYIAMWVIYWVTVLACIIVVLRDNRNPIRSIAWVLALLFFPIGGLICYIFFGRSLRGQHMISRYHKRRIITKMAPRHIDLDKLDLSRSDRSLIKLARNLSSSFYTVNNELRIFTTGHEKFEALKDDLRHATRSIFIQYYIFLDDKIGHEIADILKAKAAEGVDVRVIYDHVGSFSARNKFFRDMARSGVNIHPFFRVTFPQFANRVNWRNHRKLVIIDGRVGYIGGMNIADRYAFNGTDGPAWRDTHFRVVGDIVESLMYSFVVDWNFKNHPEPLEYPKAAPVTIHNQLGMQLVTSGPMGDWDNLALCFLKAISSATKSIYIQTPYFLPTDALQRALEAASLAKIDVRIMIPRRSDSRMLRYASFSNITKCLRAGMKVYLYNPGMLHAKGMIIDDNLVTAGSTNFDFRSFENNFECNLFIYDQEVNRRMREIFFRDMANCSKLTFATWKKRPLLQRALESVVRLVSPIL